MYRTLIFKTGTRPIGHAQAKPSQASAPAEMSLHLPKHNWGTRGVDAYEKLECIGAGTYGCVAFVR